MTENATAYESLISRCDENLPPFAVTEISVDAMESHQAIRGAMERKTRRGLGDIEFAQKYESLRSNKTMLAGFSDLKDAVSSMSRTIESGIASLGSRIDSMSHTIGSVSNAIEIQNTAFDSYTSSSAIHNTELLRATKDSAWQEKEVARQLRSIETRYKYSR